MAVGRRRPRKWWRRWGAEAVPAVTQVAAVQTATVEDLVAELVGAKVAEEMVCVRGSSIRAAEQVVESRAAMGEEELLSSRTLVVAKVASCRWR